MKSFVDLLFILLCSTIVMLSQTLQIGSLEIAPAKMGSAGVSEVSADDVNLLVVYQDYCELIAKDGKRQRINNISQLGVDTMQGKCFLLSAAKNSLSHHRIMNVFSQCREAGFAVKLAAVTQTTPDKEES